MKFQKTFLFSTFSVEHLSKYLAMRLTLDLDSELPATERLQNFCIYIAPQPGQFLILNGNQTLQQVNEKFWKVNRLTHESFFWFCDVLFLLLLFITNFIEMSNSWNFVFYFTTG